MDTARRPNLFLVGAPKCGTTSLANWLGEHERVFMSPHKEPNYFAREFNRPWQRDRARYEKLFHGAGDEHSMVGEATPFYLRSTAAVPAILEYAPDARFVVGIRNPVDLVISWHRHLLNEAWESEKSTERAWRLQEKRRHGQAIPRLCLHPDFLMYAEYCALGRQLTRLLAKVPRERVFIYTLDELRTDPRAVWTDLLEFLDLPDDGREHFPVSNEGRSLPRWVTVTVRMANAARARLGIYRLGLGILSGLQRRTQRPPQDTVSMRFRNELVNYFSEDIRTLSRLSGRDCSPWLEQFLEFDSPGVVDIASRRAPRTVRRAAGRMSREGER